MISLPARGVRLVLLDIEGTTTPISFVHHTLFPYARVHVRQYLHQHAGTPAVRDVVHLLAREHATDVSSGEPPPPWTGGIDDGLTAYVEWLMDRDRKSPGLKLLQGHIWEQGYQQGVLRGQIFDDVPGAMRRWRAAGIRIAIYSSGSELAQRRLFESTPQGDLTPLISAFFDTRVGAKLSAESYRRIAEAMGENPASFLFVSDITAELSAARDASMQVVLSMRPGNAPQPDASEYERVTTFEEMGL